MLSQSQYAALDAMGIQAWGLRPAPTTVGLYLIQGDASPTSGVIVLLSESPETLTPEVVEMGQKIQQALGAHALCAQTQSAFDLFSHLSLSLSQISDILDPSVKILSLGAPDMRLSKTLRAQICVQTLALSKVARDSHLKKQVWQDVKHYKL